MKTELAKPFCLQWKDEAKKMLIKSAKTATRYSTGALDFTQMATQVDDTLHSTHLAHFEASLPQIYRSTLKRFSHILQNYIHFHLIFLSMFFLELGVFPTWHAKAADLTTLAITTGIFFTTLFAYISFLFYFQTKKPQQVTSLKETFVLSCKKQMSLPEKEAQHHLFIADALTKLSLYLEDFEETLFPSMKKIGKKAIRLFCRDDIRNFKEQLLQAASQEHLLQIRVTPTDLEVHACLANTYVLLSKLYTNQTLERFEYFAHLAIEEFKILNYYAPNDPWVHEQLANGYKELQMPEEQVKEVEILRSLKPHDKEILFLLGTLYFQQGQNAKGLRVYEELKSANYQRALDLVSCYGKQES